MITAVFGLQILAGSQLLIPITAQVLRDRKITSFQAGMQIIKKY